MAKVLFFVFLSFLNLHCGSHDQENLTFEPVRKTIVSEEKDPALILINAVETGDFEAVAEILKTGADVKVKNPEGYTLLMMAVRSQQFAITELLMNHGADPEVEHAVLGGEQQSAKDFVVGDSGTAVILTSLLSGEPVDSEMTNLPLFDSIQEKNAPNVEWLLARGANPNFVKDKKTSPLIFFFPFVELKTKNSSN